MNSEDNWNQNELSDTDPEMSEEGQTEHKGEEKTEVKVLSPVSEKMAAPVPESGERPYKENDDELATVEFRSYGILTFWILPVFFGLTFIGAPGLWFWLSVVLGLQAVIRRKPIPYLDSFFYHVSRLTFGAKFSKSNTAIPRVWWFLIVGSIITFIISFLLTISLVFILPLIILLSRRKQALRVLYFIAFLPRKEYLDYLDPELVKRRQELLARYNEKERQYMIFLRPQFTTYIVTYLLIIVIPFALLLILAPLNFLLEDDYPGVVQQFNDNSGQLAVVGIVAIIPYIFLMLPIFGRYRLNRFVSSELGRVIVETISGSAVNSIPLFDGEYFIENESDLIDMSHSTGLFSIFGRGRLTTIILTPMALISLLFREIIIAATENRTAQSTITAETFFENFFNSLDIVNGFLIFVIPVILIVILPLVLVLSDTEIKRSKWKNTTFMSSHEEISAVEDVGATINNLFKVVLGVGTITSLSNSISFLLAQTDTFTGYLITSVILVFGAILVLPGTIFMVFHHFSSGDHYLAVNYLRYLLSQSDNIAVGTIDRVYDRKVKLEEPPEDIKYMVTIYGRTPTSEEILGG